MWHGGESFCFAVTIPTTAWRSVDGSYMQQKWLKSQLEEKSQAQAAQEVTNHLRGQSKYSAGRGIGGKLQEGTQQDASHDSPDWLQWSDMSGRCHLRALAGRSEQTVRLLVDLFGDAGQGGHVDRLCQRRPGQTRDGARESYLAEAAYPIT